MCRFIETIRIEDGRICNIDYHTKRLNQTRAAFWKDAKAIDLNHCITPLNLSGMQKCRIVYGHEIEDITYTPYELRSIKTLRLVTSDAIDYTYKSLNRDSLNQLFNQRGAADDILIIKNGCLTDTSIANVALYDGNDWFTPTHPLLRGTKRAELLDKKSIKEKDIQLNDLNEYSQIMLFNAMIDWGKIILPITSIEHPSEFNSRGE